MKSPSPYEERLDRASILARLEGNQELLVELVDLFLGEAPQLIESMRKSLQQGDLRELARSAHSLKGAASNFLALGTANAASQLEKDAKRGDAQAAKASLAALEVVVEHLFPELVDLCRGAAK